MIKLELTKDEYEKLEDAIKSKYKASEKDGVDFELDVGDQIDALLNAKQREKAAKKSAEEQLAAEKTARENAEKQLKAIEKQLEESKNSGDVEALNKSWEDKFEAMKTDLTGKITGKDEFIKKTLVDEQALKLATKLGTSPEALLPHIKARLAVDFDGETPSTKVLGTDGKPSALTIDELETEIKGTKHLESILIGTQGSGGGAHETSQTETGGDGATQGRSIQEKLEAGFNK